ncbi:MAG: hypothetical protein ABIT09_03990 [Croceibacterium sp.]
MKPLFTVLAMLSLAAPAAAQDVPLSLEQTLLLRCSAAFALAAGEQQRGGAGQYPPLAQRGREYFVRASARLIDELQLTREQIEARLRGEVATQQQARAQAANPEAYRDGLLQPCLIALDASGL